MRLAGVAGKVAVVTGAAGGIGTAVTAALVGHGAIVAAIDVDGAGLSALADRHSGRGPGRRRSSRRTSVIDRIETQLGAIDFLVNVAGVLRPRGVLDLSDEDWSTTFAVNATGVFHVSRAVARKMIGRRAGAIVTVASNAATVPRMTMAAYSASKAASVAFTKCLALELSRYSIRCNVVSPGSTDTEMLRGLWTGPDAEATAIAGVPDQFRLGIPLGKIARPADVADTVLFLLSDNAGHITMQNLCVDGGGALGA